MLEYKAPAADMANSKKGVVRVLKKVGRWTRGYTRLKFLKKYERVWSINPDGSTPSGCTSNFSAELRPIYSVQSVKNISKPLPFAYPFLPKGLRYKSSRIIVEVLRKLIYSTFQSDSPQFLRKIRIHGLCGPS